jgi:hypothetical protein
VCYAQGRTAFLNQAGAQQFPPQRTEVTRPDPHGATSSKGIGTGLVAGRGYVPIKVGVYSFVSP